ncbi:hypothetical protein BCEP4_140043 [Burkholderia cepacia]|nr:hypothetical protein BCEP4_140043 [Burkholderia cepacia]
MLRQKWGNKGARQNKIFIAMQLQKRAFLIIHLKLHWEVQLLIWTS